MMHVRIYFTDNSKLFSTVPQLLNCFSQFPLTHIIPQVNQQGKLQSKFQKRWQGAVRSMDLSVFMQEKQWLFHVVFEQMHFSHF